MTKQLYVCVGIEISTEQCIGVDFCKNEEQLRFKADMFRRDLGDEYLILEYPSREASVVDGFAALAVVASTAAAQKALSGALHQLHGN